MAENLKPINSIQPSTTISRLTSTDRDGKSQNKNFYQKNNKTQQQNERKISDTIEQQDLSDSTTIDIKA